MKADKATPKVPVTAKPRARYCSRIDPGPALAVKLQTTPAITRNQINTDLSQLLRKLGAMLLSLLALQITLGISNVLGYLPLSIAVAHNGGAALLLLLLVTLLWISRRHE
jgi:hypothetical protein